MPRLLAWSRNRRRRQRIARRHGRLRAHELPGGAADRGRESWARRRLEHRPPRDRQPLRPSPERRRVARRGRARPTCRLRRDASTGGSARAAALEPGRNAPTLGSRVPDAVAARNRVLLSAQARTGLDGVERVLRGWLRPRRGSQRRGRDGRVHARSPRGRRRGRLLRRGLLPLQRGDRLVLPVPQSRLGGRVLPRRRVRARSWRGARRALYRENLRGHLLFLWKHHGPKVAERARRLLLASLRLRGIVFRGERGRVYRDAAGWLSSGDAAMLLDR